MMTEKHLTGQQQRDPSDLCRLPVGVFDSGVGGISVLREMVRLLPQEDFLFFGDSANAPYGTRPMGQIRELTLAGVRHLRERGIKAVVIACNTATSAAIADLREMYRDMPVIGIEPAIKPAIIPGGGQRTDQTELTDREPTDKELTDRGLADRELRDRAVSPRKQERSGQGETQRNVLVLATPFTIQGEKLHHLIDIYDKSAHIMPLACPGLMEFAEQGVFEGPEVDELLERLLEPVRGQRIDAVVLGCTHYPFLRKAIRKALGEGPQILDGSEGTARQLKRRLRETGLLCTDRERPGQVRFEMSLPGKEALCRMLLES